MKKLIILFASVLLVAVVIAVAVVATETETDAETDIVEETVETTLLETIENEVTETDDMNDSEVVDMDGEWEYDIFDADNVVDVELLESIHVGMTEKEIIELLGYPVDMYGCGYVGILYILSDGSECRIYSESGTSWTNRTVNRIFIWRCSDRTAVIFRYGTDEQVYRKVYSSGELLIDEIAGDATIASTLIDFDTGVIAKTAAESDNTDEASE
ncbi:MAG: outer membrane protein assembly factor BamE [Clostridiales bacterium]|nr:outer membrane protein assembly factor BamE [Clostridiales bacterium]